jgi:hypothetical protein
MNQEDNVDVYKTKSCESEATPFLTPMQLK